MPDYKVVNVEDVDNYSSNGEMRMLRGVIGSDQVTITYRMFPAGYKSSHGHTHSKIDEIVYVMSGKLQVRLDDDIVELGAKTALKIPPHIKRGYRNPFDKNAEVLVVSVQGELVGDNGGTPDHEWWPD
jgi:uncharacterized cupin superfamily protein